MSRPKSPPHPCAFCTAPVVEPRRRFCGRSCAAKDKWRRGVLNAAIVGRKPAPRPLPPAIAAIAATADRVLALLIREQHDDDVPFVRRRTLRVDADAMVDPWEDPTAEAAIWG